LRASRRATDHLERRDADGRCGDDGFLPIPGEPSASTVAATPRSGAQPHCASNSSLQRYHTGPPVNHIGLFIFHSAHAADLASQASSLVVGPAEAGAEVASKDRETAAAAAIRRDFFMIRSPFCFSFAILIDDDGTVTGPP